MKDDVVLVEWSGLLESLWWKKHVRALERGWREGACDMALYTVL